MAMLMDLDFTSFGYSGTTTTTTTTGSALSDDGCNWNAWSPVVDWEALSGGQEDFHNLVDSMMDESDFGLQGLNVRPNIDIEEECHYLYNATTTDHDESNGPEDLKGMRLIHLLVAAAEALEGTNKCHELARVILVRLRELVSPKQGTNMERLAAYFTDALQGLLDGGGKCGGNHLYKAEHHPTDVLAAFQLLQDVSPYVKFGHFTANQAILEAVTHDKRIHIVDYDIMEGIQWASLMQALVSRKDGPATPHLRITALSRSCGGRRSFSTIQETGRRLTAFAASIGQPFSFHQCRLDSDETFKPSNLKLVRGEALIINCMLHLPHFSYRAPNSIASFISGAQTLGPRLVTLVEEEIGPTGEEGFVGRFMDSLHHYSAIYDSLEAGFPMQGRARTLVERVFLGPRISGSLARIYRGGGEEEGCSWGQRLAACGFCPTNISFANHCQAKLLIGLYNDGYRVEESSINKLVLGWKSRRLLSVSIWSSKDNES
ncbi:nodulation-signaling pathway 2 protein [Dorcoceras hygrometricum]|uniref:Nodulation-signaling pathway 2 protein n=1 Tax=Dorcoceras hygrometricum TaxID=472368 RepID=A0A2Z7BLE7_9LAMI|nr:nodulation-signaling pathway 2 protein [Dorcoceras hygrometricum]